MDVFVELALNFTISFLASCCWAILFGVPSRRILAAGGCGALGWITWYGASQLGGSPITNTLLGAIVVGLIGEALARILREPATLFITAGIVPLVPGAAAFAAMQAFVIGDYLTGIELTTKAVLVAGAIAGGIAVATPVVRQLFHLIRKR